MKLPTLIAFVGGVSFAASQPSDVRHARRAASCGLQGYDQGNPSAYHYSSRASSASQSACGAQCAKDSKCETFAVGSGICLLYSSSLTTNFKASTDSPYTFYEKSCIASSSVPSRSVVNPRPSASNSPNGPVSGTGICGQAGYDKGEPQAFYSSAKKANANIDKCSALCKSKRGCLSFAVGKKSCLLYGGRLDGNFESDSGSQYVFYDLSCFQSLASSTPLSTSTFSSLVAESSTVSSTDVTTSSEQFTTTTSREAFLSAASSGFLLSALSSTGSPSTTAESSSSPVASSHSVSYVVSPSLTASVPISSNTGSSSITESSSSPIASSQSTSHVASSSLTASVDVSSHIASSSTSRIVSSTDVSSTTASSSASLIATSTVLSSGVSRSTSSAILVSSSTASSSPALTGASSTFVSLARSSDTSPSASSAILSSRSTASSSPDLSVASSSLASSVATSPSSFSSAYSPSLSVSEASYTSSAIPTTSSVAPPPAFKVAFSAESITQSTLVDISYDSSTNTTTFTFGRGANSSEASITAQLPGDLSGTNADGSAKFFIVGGEISIEQPTTKRLRARGDVAGCHYLVIVDSVTVIDLDLAAVVAAGRFQYTTDPFAIKQQGSEFLQKVVCPAGVLVPVVSVRRNYFYISDKSGVATGPLEGQICGMPGLQASNTPYWTTSNRRSTTSTMDEIVESCASDCKKNNCTSYYVTPSRRCWLFDLPVAKLSFPAGGGQSFYFDANCTLKDPAPALNATEPVCNAVGVPFLARSERVFFDESGKYGNFASCASLCKALKCGSFGYTPSSCYMYQLDSSQGRFSPSNYIKNVTWYDGSCLTGDSSAYPLPSSFANATTQTCYPPAGTNITSVAVEGVELYTWSSYARGVAAYWKAPASAETTPEACYKLCQATSCTVFSVSSYKYDCHLFLGEAPNVFWLGSSKMPGTQFYNVGCGPNPTEVYPPYQTL